MKILAVHIYNDFSGSPLVLSQLLEYWSKKNYDVHLYTSGQKGRLSDIPKVKYHLHNYNRSENKLKTLLDFIKVNYILYKKIKRDARKGDVVYINTLMPFGAALAARKRGAKVIYHVHETSVRPERLKAFLKWIQRKTASFNIYVSKYLKKTEGFDASNEFVVHNVLSDKFFERANRFLEQKRDEEKKSVLMLASLRAYKGVNEFLELARLLPDKPFDLVLNASEDEIKKFMKNQQIPENLNVWPAIKDVHPFYQRAKIVVNLSRPDQWIETFGMTIIEAMAYGLPVIVPPTGGPAEIVKEGFGFTLSCYNLKEIAGVLSALYNRDELYKRLSENAAEEAKKFRSAKFNETIEDIVFGTFTKENT